MIAYGKIFKQAFVYLRTHKFLWVLGLFLIWGQLLNLFSYKANSKPDQSWKNLVNFVSMHKDLAVWLFAAAVVVFVILLILYFRAKAAIILGTKNIIEKKETGFQKSLKASKTYYIRLFGIWFITGFLLMLAFGVLAGPVVYLNSIHYAGRAAVLAVLALVIFVPLAVIASFINNLAPMFVVIHNMKINQAIASSYDMVKKFWTGMLIFAILLGILTAMILIVLAGVGSIGVVILGYLFYHTVGIPVSTGLILTGIVALIAFLIIGSAIASYQQICWVLLFNELVRPQKLEEEETLPVPEVV